MGLILVYQDVHLWAVIFSVIVINYIFQDGKSDYFQGTSFGQKPHTDSFQCLHGRASANGAMGRRIDPS